MPLLINVYFAFEKCESISKYEKKNVRFVFIQFFKFLPASSVEPHVEQHNSPEARCDSNDQGQLFQPSTDCRRGVRI